MNRKVFGSGIIGVTFSIVAFAMSISSCEYAPHDAAKVAEADVLPSHRYCCCNHGSAQHGRQSCQKGFGGIRQTPFIRRLS